MYYEEKNLLIAVLLLFNCIISVGEKITMWKSKV